MLHTITTGASDRRMAKPADLVALDSALTEATARTYLDAAGRMVTGPEGLRYEPWRTVWTSSLEGSGVGYILSPAKPIESVASVADSAGSAYTDYTLGSNGLGIPDRLERDDGWGKSYQSGLGISLVEWGESEKPEWSIVWTLGWLMPGQISTWAASTAYKTEPASTSYDDPDTASAYASGAWVRSSDPRVTLRFECTTAGTSGASEPSGFTAAATAAGDTITDNTATWTARAAREIPADLSLAVLDLAAYLASDEAREPGDVKRRKASGSEVEYFAAGSAGVLKRIEAWR